MQYKMKLVRVVTMLALPLLWVAFLLISGDALQARAYDLPLVTLSSAIPSSTVLPPSMLNKSTSTNVIQLVLGLDSTILAALIGAVCTLFTVLFSVLFSARSAAKQAKRTHQLEQKIRDEQHKRDQELRDAQYKHERELRDEQRKHEEEMDRQRKEFEAKKQKEEEEAAKEKVVRIKTLFASGGEWAKDYREALHNDPRISDLQILDMSHPLKVTNIYVPVCVHQDARTVFGPPVILSGDPNALLQASFKLLEHRVSSATTPEEAICTYKRCVFVGDPGAGKTTLLKYLTLKSANNQLAGLPDLPIYIELNAFASSGHHDLLDFVATNWDEYYAFPKADAREAMEEPLKMGKVLLLLDALDEAAIGITPEAVETSYQVVSTAIVQLATRYPQVPIVVTARKAGYQQRASLIGFTELEVLDFRLTDMQQFVTNWFNSYTDQQKRANGAKLNATLEANPRIQALAANPLLLSLIVLVYEKQLDLQDRRAELYKRCVDILIAEWDAKRNKRRNPRFKIEHKRQLLAELAWYFHQQGRRYFPENEVLNQIARFLPKVQLLPERNGSMLEEILSDHGLLKEQARGWQGFLHLTLQEFFVAQYVTDHQELDILLAHRGDPWWEEVLLLYAGLTPDASPLLRKLGGLDSKELFPEDIFCTNLILAGRCLAARPIIQQIELWDSIINQLFAILERTSYFLIQQLIAEALAAIGDLKVNTRLLRLLANERINLSARQFIANALGQSRELEVVPELILLLSNTRVNRYVRGSIANALGQAEERSVAPELARLLSNKQVVQEVQQNSANALREVGESSLIHLLSDEEYQETGKYVYMNIVDYAKATSFDLMRLPTAKQSDQDVRWDIAHALGVLQEPSVVSELMHLLFEEQIELHVRIYICEALGLLGEKSVASQLVQALCDQQIDQDVRKSIAETLGALGEKSIVLELVRLLPNEQLNQGVRENIALALGQLGERSVVPELIQMYSNQQMNQNVRWCIASTLARLGERSVVPELVQLLSNEQVASGTRRDISDALGQLGERSIISELMQLLPNGQIDPFVRWSIADTIGQLGDCSIASELVRLLFNNQANPGVLCHIVGAVGRLGERSVVPELAQLLDDEQINLEVRRSLTIVLGELANDEETVHKLGAHLQTSDMTNFVHRALWAVSRRAGVRVFVSDGTNRRRLEVVRW